MLIRDRSSMASSLLKIGIIGIGFGQQAHIPVFKNHPLCDIVGICASRKERADKIAHRYNIKHGFSDWRVMLDSLKLDALAIAVPPGIQPPITMEALKRKIAVFCEKPLALTLSDAEHMTRLARNGEVAHMVDFEFPELPEWQHVSAMLREGSIGVLRHINVSWMVESYPFKHGLQSWKTCYEQGGGVLHNFVTHVFHYLEWFAGPIAQLKGSLFQSPKPDQTGDVLNLISCKHANGVVSSVTSSVTAYMGSGHRLEFYGDQGTILLENRAPGYRQGYRILHAVRNRESFQEILLSKSSPNESEDIRIQAIQSLRDRFVIWITSGQVQEPNFEQGLRVQQLMALTQESDTQECWTNCEQKISITST